MRKAQITNEETFSHLYINDFNGFFSNPSLFPSMLLLFVKRQTIISLEASKA